MASLTEVLAANNQGPTEKMDIAGDLSSGIKAGIQLATAADQVEAAKAQVADKKLELATKQATAMTNRTKAAMYAQSDAAFKSIMDSNKAYANSLNLPYNDEALRAAWKDPNLRLADQKEINRVQAGGRLENPQAVIDFFGSDSPAIFSHLQDASYANSQVKNKQDFELQKQRELINAQKEIAGIKKGTAPGSSPKPVELSAGEKARDVKFAKEYSEFFDQGGAAVVESNIDSLSDSIKTLKAGKTTAAEGFVSNSVGNVLFPETANVRTNITSVLIQGLKDTFGGQLSDGERKAMVESAYVASADPKQNAARVEKLADKIKAAARAKQVAGQYFEDNGTLKGVKGTPSFDIGGKTVKVDQAAPTSKSESQQSVASADQDIEEKLKTLPPGADINLARAALIKAKQMKTAGK